MDVSGNNMQIAVTHAPLGNDGIGEIANIIRWPAQNHGLQTGIVVQMDVKGRQAEIMMIMLALGQPTRQLALVVIENIRQTADAMGGGAAFQPLALQFFANNVAESLGPVQITVSGHELVELNQKVVIQRYGDSFHRL